ncbi:MAG: NAD(P)/FAD-dependent oxidoreductase [Thermoleophilaceae bacterium]|nr:NAD(P)/FAD-dependent oxidoreductase [Thermoleophilaceae bacterium]
MSTTKAKTAVEHVDVLIVGAGLSGIGAACHLRSDCPGKTFAILEAREASGGTWDLFRYPGIRSDSDMFTLGYSFRPWLEAKAIADGPSILDYIRDTARDHGIDEQIRYHHRVVRAEWSTEESRWTVEAERTDTGETVHLTCGFMLACTGYYNYDEGYTPEFEGIEGFGGQIIHPQHWPADLDYDAKRVIVIGSGATAVTLVPAMAERAASVTMLQRSPTYIVSMPAKDPVADLLRKTLPSKVAYSIARWKNVAIQLGFYNLAQRFPRLTRAVLRKGVAMRLPNDYEIDKHFNPRYDPWDQRICLVPDADLFKALRGGKASIVTDGIEAFTERGLKLTSGTELEADIIITATGLNLVALGGMSVAVDGRDVDFSECVAYKGMMFSGIPNAAVTFGYTNASWTLKADLVAQHICRLLQHMDANGYTQVTPRWSGAALPEDPFIDLASGYVLRSAAEFPKQGPRSPWRLHQNYARDILLLRHRDVDDAALEFSAATSTVGKNTPIAA